MGVFAIQALFHTVEDMGLSVEAVDKYGASHGPSPKAHVPHLRRGGYRHAGHVAKGVADKCPDDERVEVFAIPSYVNTS